MDFTNIADNCFEVGAENQRLVPGGTHHAAFAPTTSPHARAQRLPLPRGCLMAASWLPAPLLTIPHEPSPLLPLPLLQPRELLRMEAAVLSALGYRINTPTTHTFLSMYKQASGA